MPSDSPPPRSRCGAAGLSFGRPGIALGSVTFSASIPRWSRFPAAVHPVILLRIPHYEALETGAVGAHQSLDFQRWLHPRVRYPGSERLVASPQEERALEAGQEPEEDVVEDQGEDKAEDGPQDQPQEQAVAQEEK